MPVRTGVSAEDVAMAGMEPMPWFSHDSSASRDRKVRRLIKREGVEGYGRWWLLCEALASTRGHRLDVSDEESMEILADELLCGVDELGEFLGQLSDVGLIRGLDEGLVYSERMERNALTFGAKRAGGRLGGRPRKQAPVPPTEA